jgi:hypothetical protein
VPEPPAQTGTTQGTTLLMTEWHLMLMSNSELKEECRRRNLSASGNKTALVQRLLTLIEPIVAVARPSLPPPPEQNDNAPTMGESGNPPPAGEMTESQLMLLSNAALRDLLKQWNQSTNGNKQILIQRLLLGERMRAFLRTRNMEEQLTGFPHGAKWRELIPLTEAVAIVTADGLRAPTVPENKASAPKLNFGETFDREPFTDLQNCQRQIGKGQKRQSDIRTRN